MYPQPICGLRDKDPCLDVDLLTQEGRFIPAQHLHIKLVNRQLRREDEAESYWSTPGLRGFLLVNNAVNDEEQKPTFHHLFTLSLVPETQYN